MTTLGSRLGSRLHPWVNGSGKIQKRGPLIWLVSVAVVGIICLWFAMVWSRTEVPDADHANVNDIADFPATYAGQSVTVKAKVYNRVSDESFAIRDAGILRGSKLLVFPEAGTPEVTIGDVARISGTVGVFRIEDVEQQLGRDLDEHLYSSWEGHGYLVAKQVVR